MTLEMLKQRVAVEAKALARGRNDPRSFEEAIKGLTKLLRADHAPPEKMLVHVKDAIFQASLGPTRAGLQLEDGQLIRDLTEKAVRLAIEAYYSEQDIRDQSASAPASPRSIPSQRSAFPFHISRSGRR